MRITSNEEGREMKKYHVWGTTSVVYEIEAESEEEAIDEAEVMLAHSLPDFDWEVTEIEEEKDE